MTDLLTQLTTPQTAADIAAPANDDRLEDDMARCMAAGLLGDPPTVEKAAAPTADKADPPRSKPVQSRRSIATPPPVPEPEPEAEPVAAQSAPVAGSVEPKASRGHRLIEASLVVVISVVGMVLRVVNLGVVGLNSDEAVYAGQGGSLLGVGALPEHFSIFRAHPLFLQFTMGVVFRTVGQSDVAARLVVSAVFGMGSVVFTYLLARELYGARVAIGSAAVLAVMPYHVVVSRQVLVDTPMGFFAVAGVYITVRASRLNRQRDLYFAFVALALAAISKEIAVLMVPVVVGWMTLGPLRVPVRRFVGPAAVFAVICLPFPLTRLVNQPGNASQFFLWQFTRAPNHAPGYFLNVLRQFGGTVFVVLMFVGIAALIVRRSNSDQLLLFWIIPLGLFFQFWPTKLFPYLFVILPALVVAAVVVVDRLFAALIGERRSVFALATVVSALSLSLTFGSAGIVLAGPTAELEGFGDFDIEVQTFAGSREFSEWAGDNTPDDSRFLTIGPSLGNILRFYGSRDSVALSVSSNPARRNPAYIPVPNPNLAMRQMSVHYVVWDAYSADRSAFYNARLRSFARQLGGEIVFSAWAEGEQLVTASSAPPPGVDVRIVVWDVPGAGSTTGGQREAGLT